MKKRFSIILFSSLVFFSCISFDKMVSSKVGSLFSDDSVMALITGEEDPQLLKESLPVVIKTLELLAETSPKNRELQLTTGLLFASYAAMFVQLPATYQNFHEKRAMVARAEKLYLRSLTYLERALNLRFKNFSERIEEENLDKLVLEMGEDDVGMLYWYAAAWFGALSCNAMNFDLSVRLYQPIILLYRAYQLDSSYSDGAIDTLLIQAHSAIPAGSFGLGSIRSPQVFEPFYNTIYKDRATAKEKALFHFDRALTLTNYSTTAPYLAMATTFSIKEQNVEEFREYLNRALAIDPNEYTSQRLLTILQQEQAEWYIEKEGDFFL